MNRLVILVILLTQVSLLSVSTVVGQTQKGVALNTLRFYSDSTYESTPLGFVDAKKILHIEQVSQARHLDKDQHQYFKWYLVQQGEQRGWVFGDDLAVLTNNNDLPNWDPKFANTAALPEDWGSGTFNLGVLEGQDEVADQYIGALFYEYYLIFERNDGYISLIPIGLRDQRGSKLPLAIYFCELTGDYFSELVLYQETTHPTRGILSRTVSIYHLSQVPFGNDAGWQPILEEELKLPADNPAGYKAIHINNTQVRIEYPSFDKVETNRPLEQEYDVRLWSTTYVWDDFAQRYRTFYEPSLSPIKATVDCRVATLRGTPYNTDPGINFVKANDEVRILSTHFSRKKNPDGELFIKVRTLKGKTGYLRAKDIVPDLADHQTTLLNVWRGGRNRQVAKDYLYINEQSCQARWLAY